MFLDLGPQVCDGNDTVGVVLCRYHPLVPIVGGGEDGLDHLHNEGCPTIARLFT